MAQESHATFTGILVVKKYTGFVKAFNAAKMIFMNKKYLITATILSLSAVAGFSQDTSKLPVSKQLKNNTASLPVINPDSGIINSKAGLDRAHTIINPNRGTAIPSTTSGTLNSPVNPNTQIVIPLGKRKRNPNPNTFSDTGTIVPVRK